MSSESGWSRIFLGALLVVVGLLLLLNMLGVLNFSMWHAVSKYWPVGIILVGIAIILRVRWIAFTLLVLTIILGVVYAGDRLTVGEPRTIIQTLPPQAVSSADISLHYGAGEMRVGPGTSSFLLKNDVSTSDQDDPSLSMDIKDSKAIVTLKRSDNANFWHHGRENWNVSLDPGVAYDLQFDYGAASAVLDFRTLNVTSLKMSSGATDTTIYFGESPLQGTIETGASSLKFKFPKGMGVRIKVDGGAVSTDFKDFTRQPGDKDDEGGERSGKSEPSRGQHGTVFGTAYYVSNYPSERNIDLEIEAGASSIKAEFY